MREDGNIIVWEQPLAERQRGAPIDGALNAWAYDITIDTDRPATDFTPRVLPCHAQAAVPLESHLIRWWP